MYFYNIKFPKMLLFAVIWESEKIPWHQQQIIIENTDDNISWYKRVLKHLNSGGMGGSQAWIKKEAILWKMSLNTLIIIKVLLRY